MRLLKDDELVAQITKPEPIIKGIKPPADWYGKDSPIQPSSIDLHVGNIFLPGTKENDQGSATKPLSEHILKPGYTAVVTTLEEISLPGNIAGIGFPPSRVSFRGILMTNPGHIDPGYVGHMRFTVINMGKQEYPLRRGDDIVTVLLVVLSAPARRNWLERRPNGHPAAPPTQEDLDRLSADFMNLETRATRISEKTVRDAELRIKMLQWLAPAIVTVIAAVITGYFTWAKPAWREPLEDVKREVAVLNKSLDVKDVKTRIEELERRLKGSTRIPGASGPKPRPES